METDSLLHYVIGRRILTLIERLMTMMSEQSNLTKHLYTCKPVTSLKCMSLLFRVTGICLDFLVKKVIFYASKSTTFYTLLCANTHLFKVCT